MFDVSLIRRNDVVARGFAIWYMPGMLVRPRGIPADMVTMCVVMRTSVTTMMMCCW